jgi:predicted nucleotidyltransferase
MISNREAIVGQLQTQLPGLLAIYAFGSRVQGNANAGSDLDLAVLVAGYAPPLRLWALANALAELAGCEVDLLDLRAASTVMQYQVIATGERWWAADVQSVLYEAMILSERTELERARAGLLGDIEQQGSVYGR